MNKKSLNQKKCKSCFWTSLRAVVETELCLAQVGLSGKLLLCCRTFGLGPEAAGSAALINWLLHVSRRPKLDLVLMANKVICGP